MPCQEIDLQRETEEKARQPETKLGALSRDTLRHNLLVSNNMPTGMPTDMPTHTLPPAPMLP
jgi:hypothetical protein